jgi:hypothetical protein
MAQDEIARLLDLSEDNLLREIGVSISRGALQGSGRPRGAYIEAGKQWLEDKRGAICAAAKKSQIIRDFVSGKKLCLVRRICGRRQAPAVCQAHDTARFP